MTGHIKRTINGLRTTARLVKKKRCIYAMDQFDDNLCVWRCLVIYKRLVRGEKNRLQERNCDAANNLARKYYGDKNF